MSPFLTVALFFGFMLLVQGAFWMAGGMEGLVLTAFFWYFAGTPVAGLLSGISGYSSFERSHRQFALQDLSVTNLTGKEIIDHYLAYVHNLPGSLALVFFFCNFIVLMLGAAELACAFLIPLLTICFFVYFAGNFSLHAALRIWLFKKREGAEGLSIAADVFRPWIYIQILPAVALISFLWLVWNSHDYFAVFGMVLLLGTLYYAASSIGLFVYLHKETSSCHDLLLIRQRDWCRVTGEQAEWVPKRPFQRWPHPYKTDWSKIDEEGAA